MDKISMLFGVEMMAQGIRFLFIISSCLVSCLVWAVDIKEEAMMIKASELTKLSAAIESAVRYDHEQSASLDGPALLKFATQDDPVLLSRFTGFKVQVFSVNRHAAVLICSADGSQALLEDAGCTAAMDRHAWREIPKADCKFKLDLQSLCSMRAETVRSAVTPAAITLSPKVIVPFIEVAKVVWTEDVNKETKQPGAVVLKGKVGKKLVLWMQVEGSQDALSQLIAQGKLPIRHKWFHESITGFRPAGVVAPVDEIEIPAAGFSVVEKLNREIELIGYFNWRTWSAKENLVRGGWRVTVVYADNTPVLCNAAVGRRPCEYTIEVR